ncbi:unnamed protein product [Protopolystoma xenopodis]|uniref:CTCK domain-containing protein n=1 Tax=Protopolystoma xenopodis TaxID=117903 RepID=A0A448XBS4_9PLAT|nr:unnamed protein product [Protopolystoma xenopodis]
MVFFFVFLLFYFALLKIVVLSRFQEEADNRMLLLSSSSVSSAYTTNCHCCRVSQAVPVSPGPVVCDSPDGGNRTVYPVAMSATQCTCEEKC